MKPEISVVLATHNGGHLLPMVLEGLARQSLHQSRFEIIVVDDGSTDNTQHVLHDWQNHLKLHIIRQNQAGMAAAKSLGVFVACTAIVVFLGDDVVPEPDFLVMHLAAHLASPDRAVAVLGYTSLAEDIRQIPVMWYVTEVGYQLFSYGWMQSGQELDHTAFGGGCVSCKRSFLVQKGVFNPNLDSGFADIELGWRLARHGLRMIYQPQAHSVMIRALTFDQLCERSYQLGRSQYRFAQSHKAVEIQAYCEIVPALQEWRDYGQSYEAHLLRTRELDCQALVWEQAKTPVTLSFQQDLNEAYRKVFSLSRAKGVVDAQASVADPLI